MKSELVSVSKLFTETLLRVPDYQRGYAWRMRQLKEFWADVDQLEPSHNHYTGVLTLEAVPAGLVSTWAEDRWIVESKHFTPYYVVDGQQRLTTIVIFLQCILDRLGTTDELNYTTAAEIRKKFIFESRNLGISRSYIFGYERDNPSYEFLKREIFQEQSDEHALDEETIYTHNLRSARDFFAEQLTEKSLAELEALYTKVSQNLLFNIYLISDEIDVFVAFETMNNRGKPLSNLELLKNRLIYLSTNFQVETSEREQLRRVINESWKTLYHYLGKNKDRPLVDDTFLSIHHWLYFRPALVCEQTEGYSRRFYWSGGHEDYKEELLEKIFTLRNMRGGAAAHSGVRDATDVEPQIEGTPARPPLTPNYLYDYARDIKNAVRKYYEISNPEGIGLSDDEQIWLTRLRRLGDDEDSILILAAYLTEIPAPSRVKFLSTFEMALFITRFTPYHSVENVPLISRLGVNLISGKSTLEEITSDLEKFHHALAKKAESGKVIQDWSKGSGAYGWRGIKYFLFEYEQELLQGSKTAREKLVWEVFAQEKYDVDYLTVEHIYPQRAAAEEWRDAFANFSQKEKNVLKNSLGNLVPLSRPKNSSLGRLGFTEKKGRDGSTVGYRYGCYSENELCEHSQWTAREILMRGIRLLEFLERRWGFSLGDRNRKVAVLGLQFVLREYPELRETLD